MNLGKIKTVNELLKYGSDFLKDNSIENYDYSSKEILGHILSFSNTELIFNKDFKVSYSDEKIYLTFLERRRKNEPIQYITNTAYFMDLKLYVNKSVLIPRFETEILVDIIINYIKNNNSYNKVLEIGVGSGCISLSLGYYLKNIKILGVDISKEALEISKKNSKLNNISNVAFMESNIFENLTSKFDIIVSNPPYIESKTIETLSNDVKDFEPILALDGGIDGLDFYREIIASSKNYLNENGMVFFEIGYNQGLQVKRLLEDNNFSNIKIIKDYSNYDRIVLASKE